MKRLIALSLLLVALPVFPTSAASTITLAEPTHRSSSGIFFNDDLASLISPSGRLGQLLFDRTGRTKTWIIDAALVEEIADLADGYTYLGSDKKEVRVPELVLADIWINTLKSATKNSAVLALPYGNPSDSLLAKIAPDELALYRNLGQSRLSLALSKKDVGTTNFTGTPSVSPAAIKAYTPLRQSIEMINSLITLKSIEDQRLKLAQLLDPTLTPERLGELATDLRIANLELQKKVRISGGNYTITSSRYELPITVVNDFEQQVNLDVRISPTNARVIVGKIPRISVGAQSQLQLKIPITVIASGDTNLRIQLWTPAGGKVGEERRIPLRLAVISSSTTWFATVLTVILLLAVITQSVRRVKRRRANG
jgi:hypothetical protein